MNELERIGLISRVCSELDNHLGFSDKTLAEFVVHLSTLHTTAPAFQKALQENGAEVPLSFAENLLRVINALSQQAKNRIEHPKVAVNPPRDERDKAFSGLRISNTGAVPLVDLPHESAGSLNTDTSLPSTSRDQRDEGSRDGGRHGRDRDHRDHYGERRRRSRSRSPMRDDRRDRYSRHRSRSRSRSPPRKDRRYQASGEVELHAIYDGRVSNVMDFGCFVELEGFNKKEGLVHVSQVHGGGSRDIRQFVRRGDRVKVKVVALSGSKISLSMKEVDQRSGEDLLPRDSDGARGSDRLQFSNPAPPSKREGQTSVSAGTTAESEQESARRRPPKRLSSPELWEARQLIASGVLPVSAYPTFDADTGGGLLGVAEPEEDVEVEVSEVEPLFLRGQTKVSRDLSPIRIVKNPDGSLQRAALHQSQLSKERRELKQAQANNLADSMPRDLSKPWNDPMASEEDRVFATELRQMTAAHEMPEWKLKTQPKGISFGQISNKSIREQRESLPIFKLKTELCDAISKNQVLVVIGETGECVGT